MQNVGKENEKSVNDVAKKAVKTFKLVKWLIGFVGGTNLLIIFGALLLVILFIGVIFSSSSNTTTSDSFTYVGLSETTLAWEGAVTKEAKKQDAVDLIPYILAIIQVETNGTGQDIMQSSESAGLAVNSLSPTQSIKQGIKHLKSLQSLAKRYGYSDYLGIIQAYNFGTGYLKHLVATKKTHSIEVAENYSKTVVAPSLGNKTGAKCEYNNAIAVSYNGGYRYCNGGNFFYSELIKQYLAEGGGSPGKVVGSASFKKIMAEATKYTGWEYSWGGYNPTMGFDCSGLTQWSFKKAGISLPRTAIEQWGATKKIAIKDAKPGDLIFFKGTYGGPNHISHVGIYVDKNRMYDSNGGGIGYHNWNDSYWSAHFDSIHRVK